MSETEKEVPVAAPAESTENPVEATATEQTEIPAAEAVSENPAETPAEDKPTEEKTAEATDEAEPKTEKREPKILKTTAKINREDHNKNVKSDPDTLEISDDPNAIRKQVEYYFGDSNLPLDKFMWEQTGGEANRPVPLKTVCRFKRMKRFQPYHAIVNALKESKCLDLVGESGNEAVKRKTPFTPSSERKQKVMASSVYVKGFGDEWPRAQFELEAWFGKFGTVNNVKLRRTAEKFFKGSVFVEFDDEDTANKFIAAEPKWKDDYDLKIMKKKDYCDEKNQLIREGKIEPSQSAAPFRGDTPRGRGRGNFKGGRGGKADSDDWKKRRENDQRKGHRDHQRGRGRGGRFRGRGGRGGFKAGRDRDRDGDRDGAQEKPKEHNPNGVTPPRINASEPPKTDRPAESATKIEGVKESSENANGNGKRTRENGEATDERPTKKANVETPATEAS